MSTRDPNVSAAVMVALYALLLISCLCVVLFVPGNWAPWRRIGIAIPVLAVMGPPLLLRLAERSRIREAIREMAGTVITIRRLPFWRQGWEYYSVGHVAPTYAVVFQDVLGTEIHAMCRSGFLRGVEWLSFEERPRSSAGTALS